MIREIRSKCRDYKGREGKEINAFLTRFDGKYGIVRCSHFNKEYTIELLSSIKSISGKSVDIKTLGTSGTIKALLKKHMDISL